MAEQLYPIVKHPRAGAALGVLVSIPHYGTEALPGVVPEDYAKPSHVALPAGYADTFAAEVYGGADAYGAHVLASPYSRLFVDVNRRRDDFECTADIVTSKRGVVRTHMINEAPIFAEPLSARLAEERLARFYDPYHASLHRLLDEISTRRGRVVLLDAHTGSPRLMKDHEVIVGTRRGSTARRDLVERVTALLAAAGFDVAEDVPGYAGGHIVKRYGDPEGSGVEAIQLEINAAVLSATPRDEFIPRKIRGEPPVADPSVVDRFRHCVAGIVAAVAQ